MKNKHEALKAQIEKERQEDLKYCTYHTKHIIPMPECYLKSPEQDGTFWYSRIMALAVIECRDERKKNTSQYSMEWLRYITDEDVKDVYYHDESNYNDEIIYTNEDLTKLNDTQSAITEV